MKLEVKDCSLEYCASIIEIGKLLPVENSDNLVRTMVGDKPILVRKDEIKEGDIFIYLPIETKLNSSFVSKNNLFDWSHRELNANYKTEIEPYEASEVPIEELRKKVGYFGENCRVRIIKLLKQPSCGVLFSPSALQKWIDLSDNDIEILKSQVGTFFNTINGETLCTVYMPKTYYKGGGGRKDRSKHLEKIDRLIPGQFAFHYDTGVFGSNLFKFHPDTVCDISVKVHGTSAIIGNLKVLKPKFKTGISCVDKFLYKCLPKSWIFKEGYDTIYSSRKVIKNDELNPGHGNYYDSDIWSEYGQLFKGLLPEGMTIYGEIFGYETGTAKMIQKDYDYGCAVGTNKFMIYRITTKTENTTLEWEIEDVIDWTVKFKKDHPELDDRLYVLPSVFSGRLDNIAPIARDESLEDWRNKLVEKMRNLFKIEEKEPLCKNKVPREGVVIRIADDPIKEAFKLKSLAFFEKEAKMIDKGEVDIEMQQGEVDY